MLITLKDVSKSFGSEDILKNVNLNINGTSRIGLIGLNGSGKSTLLKMISGSLEPDSGSIYISGGTSIGYLSQDLRLDENLSIYDETLKVFSDVIGMEKELEDIRKSMEDISDETVLEKLSREFSSLSECFEEKRGYYYRGIVTGTLKGLGFSPETQDTKISLLSGGQKMRVALAKMLISAPDLLMLDEPTNYLDISGISWLENYLGSYQKAFIIVSHDRYFLDRTVSSIWEADGTIRECTGNYTTYLKLREDERYARQKAYEIQSDYIKKQREVIRKLRSFNREKFIKRAESREKMLEKIELIERPREERGARISFEAEKVISRNSLRTIDLSVGYPGNTLVSGITMDILKGRKLGVCGDNATGKTTLLRTLDGQLEPVSGEIIFGAGARISYFEQYHTDIHADRTILEELTDYSGEDTGKVRDVLAGMLFRNDEVHKTIGVLSGGETARVAVAKLMLTRCNILLLDEPTNHLDIPSKEIFEQAMKDFDGTVIAVSHDRYLLSNVCDCILYIKNRRGYFYDMPYQDAVKLFPGEEEDSPAVTEDTEEKKDKKETMSKNEVFRARRRVEELEKLMAETEKAISAYEEEMSGQDFYKDAARSLEVLDAHGRAMREKKEMENEWIELTYRLESISD